MSIYRDRARGVFVFEFDRRIPGAGRVRARKSLPKSWNQAQADAYDRQQSAALYAQATGVEGANALIEEAVTRYLIERVPQLKAGKAIAQELALMAPYYVGRPLSALPDVCKAYRLKARRDDDETLPLSPATLRNRIRYLTSAARWGWKHHNMCEHDPAEAVIVPEVKNERHVYIDRRQMLQLARACTNRTARMAIRIAFYSGMRLSEILRARPVGTAWVLDDTKNGNPRIVPISSRVAVCARRFESGPKITIQRAWERARAIVGLQHVHFHDLRHSAASELINAEIDLYTVGRVLGHKDPRSTARYAHLAVAKLAEAVGYIGRKIPQGQAKRVA